MWRSRGDTDYDASESSPHTSGWTVQPNLPRVVRGGRQTPAYIKHTPSPPKGALGPPNISLSLLFNAPPVLYPHPYPTRAVQIALS